MEKEKTNVDKFLEEYGELTKKYNVDFATYPVWVPDEKGGFKMVVQTTPIDLEQFKKEKEKFIS